MKRILFAAVLALFVAVPASAQRRASAEAGAFGQFTRYDNFTQLENGIGLGGRLGVFICQRFELEYAPDFARTRSARVGDLTGWNHRFHLSYNHPSGDDWDFLVGGGWTGSSFKTDTTKNEYDSGGNAMLGFRYKWKENWWWRADAVMDFKDPSDQTPSGERTRTLGLRFGLSRIWGGPRQANPCRRAPAPPPAPPAPAPRAAPAPQPPPPAPAPAAAPTPAPQPAAPPPAAAAPARAPAPAPRSLMTLRGVLFDFDKATLKPAALDSLERAVAYLREHADARVEVQGYTDSKGADAYNVKLSERRAEAVKARLVAQGISAGRIATRGFGESDPVADNGTDAGRALNRRVVIVELP